MDRQGTQLALNVGSEPVPEVEVLSSGEGSGEGCLSTLQTIGCGLKCETENN